MVDDGSQEHGKLPYKGEEGRYIVTSGEKIDADGWIAQIREKGVARVLLEYNYDDHVKCAISTDLPTDVIQTQIAAYFEASEISRKEPIVNDDNGDWIRESEDGSIKFTISQAVTSSSRSAPRVTIDFVDPSLPEPVFDGERDQILKNKFQSMPGLVARISRDVPQILIESIYGGLIENILDS